MTRFLSTITKLSSRINVFAESIFNSLDIVNALNCIKIMAKTSALGYILIFSPTLLAFASFGILLGGISSLQQRCGTSNASQPPLGYSAYLGAVSCDRFFSFDWFILFFEGFISILLFLFLILRRINTWRYSILGLLISATILLMFQTNTWYTAFRGLGPSYGNFTTRAKAAFSGALVGAVGNLLCILSIGTHLDQPVSEKKEAQGYRPSGAETYVTTESERPPRVTAVETVGYRPGPITS